MSANQDFQVYLSPGSAWIGTMNAVSVGAGSTSIVNSAGWVVTGSSQLLAGVAIVGSMTALPGAIATSAQLLTSVVSIGTVTAQPGIVATSAQFLSGGALVGSATALLGPNIYSVGSITALPGIVATSSQLLAGVAVAGSITALPGIIATSSQLLAGVAAVGSVGVLNFNRTLMAGSMLIGTANVLGVVSAQWIVGAALAGTMTALPGIVATSAQLLASVVQVGSISAFSHQFAGRLIDSSSALDLVSMGSANLLANTTAQIVAARGALLRTCVLSAVIVSESANIVTFLAGANTLSASFPIGSRTPIHFGYNPHAWFKTSQNTVLNLTQTQSANTAVTITFYPGV